MSGRGPAALVDVLIPTRGRKTALAVTLTGLLGQTFRDFSVVIADQTTHEPYLQDGELRSLYRALEMQGRPVRTLVNLPPRGMAQQRQFLLDQARAPLVHFLDDDVLLGPGMLERMVQVLESERCGFVGSGVSGLRHLHDLLPEDLEAFEPWAGPVRPEPHTWETIPWRRYRLHIRDNPLHLTRLHAADGRTVRYKVVWVGANVLYDRQKLLSVGGFSWWTKLPLKHSGEEVLVQLLLARRYGGCGILPAEAYHLQVPSEVPDRDVKADHMFPQLAPLLAPLTDEQASTRSAPSRLSFRGGQGVVLPSPPVGEGRVRGRTGGDRPLTTCQPCLPRPFAGYTASIPPSPPPSPFQGEGVCPPLNARAEGGRPSFMPNTWIVDLRHHLDGNGALHWLLVLHNMPAMDTHTGRFPSTPRSARPYPAASNTR